MILVQSTTKAPKSGAFFMVGSGRVGSGRVGSKRCPAGHGRRGSAAVVY